MGTAPTTAASRLDRRQVTLITIGLVSAVALLVAAWLLLASDPAPAGGPTPIEQVDQPRSGSGDPCSQQFDRAGGFMEGLDPANRCGEPGGTPRTGGRLE